MKAIEVNELTRVYRVRGVGRGLAGLLRRPVRTVVAVNGLDFEVESGTTLGLIGPNAAGKSTTVKCLAGILSPTSGRVRVMGFEPWRERYRVAQVCTTYFGHRGQLLWDLPLRDSLEVLRAIYGLDLARYRRRTEMLTEWLDLGPLWNTPVRQLSLGQRSRAELAAGLLHGPKVLLLDEPTIGLDVSGKQAIYRLIRLLQREEDVAVLLATHDLNDVEEASDRILLLLEGRSHFYGSPDTFIESRHPMRVVRITVSEPSRVLRLLPPQVATSAQVSANEVLLEVARDMASELLRPVIDADLPGLQVLVERPRLKEVVSILYEQPPAEVEA